MLISIELRSNQHGSFVQEKRTLEFKQTQVVSIWSGCLRVFLLVPEVEIEWELLEGEGREVAVKVLRLRFRLL